MRTRAAAPDFFRSRTSRVGAVYAIGAGAIALLSTANSFQAGRVVVGAVLGLADVSVVLYGVVVLWRLGVAIDDESIVLHGPLGRRFVPLREAEAFELSPVWPWRAWLVMRNGERLKVTGLGASGLRHQASKRASEVIVREANECLKRHQSAHDTDPGRDRVS